MTDDTLRDRLEVALCHALCTSDTADHDPTVHRAVNAALAVWADEGGTDLARVVAAERDRQRILAEQFEAERDVWEEHAQDIAAERDTLQQRIATVRDERDSVQGLLETANARAGRPQEERDELQARIQEALAYLADDDTPPAIRCDQAAQSLDPPHDDLAGSNKWPAQPDADRAAHAIHDVHCGCDGSMHSDANPDPSPRMARAAIRALLKGDDQ